MAIKFRSKPTGSEPAGAKADLAARFATPIEADEPVNPDPESEQPFAPLPSAEKPAKKSRGGRSR